MSRNYLISIVAIVLLSAAGWWFFNTSITHKTSEMTQPPAIQQNTNNESETSKTYRNTMYGFEFSNPPGWKNGEGDVDGYTIFRLSLANLGSDYAAWMSIVEESNVEEAIKEHINGYVLGTKIVKREKVVVGGVEGELVL
jgi:hypothetical protein